MASKRKCKYPDCHKEGKNRAYSRKENQVDYYCDTHADEILSQGRPEYIQQCPDCGCKFGVN